MHFGEMLEEDRYLDCIRLAYESGVRTFVSADVYGQGKADAALAEAIASVLDDPTLAAALSECGLQRVHEHFCWSVCARQMIHQYWRRIDAC